MLNTRNIKRHEVICPCCKQERMVQLFIDFLQAGRDIAGIPFHFNSGWRCIFHNRILGSKDTSSHIKGLAVDISAKTPGIRMTIVRSLILAAEMYEERFAEYGYRLRIIIYPKKGFIHVDIDPVKPVGLFISLDGIIT